jgi:acyl-CoA synthetase (AMP-forming)/AMP-acid ligase II
VLRTTESWVASFPHVARLTRLDAGSRVWVPGPLTATMNLFAAVHARLTGARLQQRPDGATHAQLTPASLVAALERGVPLGDVEVVVAGDRLPGALRERATSADARVSHYYGAAELSFVAWGCDEDDLVPFPGVEVSVRDGVIWTRSPYLCLGCDGPPGPFRRDPEGFATVGDRGSLSDGRLTVTGRGAEAVVTAGATIHVADVEAALRPATDGEVVVVGLPHPRLGQVVAAVLTDERSLAAARAIARERLSNEQWPRVWLHLPALPLNPAGKVDRAEVARRAADGRDARRLT